MRTPSVLEERDHAQEQVSVGLESGSAKLFLERQNLGINIGAIEVHLELR